MHKRKGMEMLVAACLGLSVVGYVVLLGGRLLRPVEPGGFAWGVFGLGVAFGGLVVLGVMGAYWALEHNGEYTPQQDWLLRPQIAAWADLKELLESAFAEGKNLPPQDEWSKWARDFAGLVHWRFQDLLNGQVEVQELVMLLTGGVLYQYPGLWEPSVCQQVWNEQLRADDRAVLAVMSFAHGEEVMRVWPKAASWRQLRQATGLSGWRVGRALRRLTAHGVLVRYVRKPDEVNPRRRILWRWADAPWYYWLFHNVVTKERRRCPVCGKELLLRDLDRARLCCADYPQCAGRFDFALLGPVQATAARPSALYDLTAQK